MIGGVQVPSTTGYKVVTKNGKVYHQYPDGRMVYVRPANSTLSQAVAHPGTANVPAAAPAAAAGAPAAQSPSALAAAAAAQGIPISTLASGFYDPALLAQQTAADTGYGDLQADTSTGLGRLTAQYGIDTGEVNRQSGYTAADLQQGLARGNQDYGVASQQNAEDFASGTSRENQDYGTQTGRVGEDYATQSGRATADYGLQSGRNTQDYGDATSRENQDYGTDTTRNTEDHTAQVADLQRSYDRLAEGQKQDINSAGLLRGGAMIQAAAKRAANQAYAQKPIDTQFQRNTQDLDTGHGRTLGDLTKGYDRGQTDLTTGYDRGQQDLTTDKDRTLADLGTGHGRTLADLTTANQRQQLGLDTGHTRLGEDTATGLSRNTDNQTAQLGQLGVNLGNQSEDLTTALGRGGRDNAQFHVDTGNEIAFQAAQGGYQPPGSPLAQAAAAAPAAAPSSGGGAGQGTSGFSGVPASIQQAINHPQPQAGYSFVQDSGSRAGMSYNVVLKGGKKYRKYSNGDMVLVP